MKKIVLIILSGIFIILIFFTDIFIQKNGLMRGVNFVADYFKADLYKENVSLKIENENLRVQLQKDQIFYFENSSLKNSDGKYLPANIFSTYPFNVKNILTVNKGIKDGVKKGAAVVIGTDIFMGQVSDILENFSSIRTVFDPDWQIPVKIGENKINGLFKGGNDPKITLIEKAVKVGDGVFSASKDFPLHLKIGEISQINEGTGGVFKEATVQVPYNIGELENVYILMQ